MVLNDGELADNGLPKAYGTVVESKEGEDWLAPWFATSRHPYQGRALSSFLIGQSQLPCSPSVPSYLIGADSSTDQSAATSYLVWPPPLCLVYQPARASISCCLGLIFPAAPVAQHLRPGALLKNCFNAGLSPYIYNVIGKLEKTFLITFPLKIPEKSHNTCDLGHSSKIVLMLDCLLTSTML